MTEYSWCARCVHPGNFCNCEEEIDFEWAAPSSRSAYGTLYLKKGNRAVSTPFAPTTDYFSEASLDSLRKQIVASYEIPDARIASRRSTVPYGTFAGDSSFIASSPSSPFILPDNFANIPVAQPELSREEKLDKIYCELHKPGITPYNYRTWREEYERTGADWAKDRMETLWKPGADDYLNTPEARPQQKQRNVIPNHRYAAFLILWGALSQFAYLDRPMGLLIGGAAALLAFGIVSLYVILNSKGH